MKNEIAAMMDEITGLKLHENCLLRNGEHEFQLKHIYVVGNKRIPVFTFECLLCGTEYRRSWGGNLTRREKKLVKKKLFPGRKTPDLPGPEGF